MNAKESLGEYGSGWGWDSEYTHAFGQTASDGTPYRINSNNLDFDTTKDMCINDIEKTSGELLYSGNIYANQFSCRAMARNAGNYYSWSGAILENGQYATIAKNSICPNGWMLTTNSAEDSRSFYSLLIWNYNISSSEANLLRAIPFSYTLTGTYGMNAMCDGRGSYGHYWSSVSNPDNSNNAYNLHIVVANFYPQYRDGSKTGYSYKYFGHSLRCVRNFAMRGISK